MSLLSLRDLCASLGGRQVLSDVTMDVDPGELVGLIGPNGAGKSTLLRRAVGLVAGTGTVMLGGADAGAMSSTDRARRMAYLPQEREIAWPVTVEMLVTLGRVPHRGAMAALGRQDHAAIDEAMARMELEPLRKRRATELSGGEKARVLIARALAQKAPLVIADEPTAGLDPAHQIALMETFAAIAAEGGAVVASLHDLGLAARWCSRLVLIDGGRILASGPPAEVLTRESLRSVYGVEAFFGADEGGLIVQPTRVTRT